FTRNAIGPMDYTPVTFSDAKYAHQTTNAHELALSVIFETPIQHFADSVDSYRAQPPEVKSFLHQVPAAWDETRVLSGEPGQTLVMARRDGGVWYVGALNGTNAAAAVDVPASFLGDGAWRAASIADRRAGDRGLVVGGVVGLKAASTLKLEMRPHGGQVMRIERAQAPPR